MKLIQSVIYFFTVVSIVCLFSCKEVPTQIVAPHFTGKNVLIEDFTGVRCVNCPQAHALIDTLIAKYPGRVEAIAFHSGIYAFPYPFSRDTFKTDESVNVENFLGPCSNYPQGTVDRKLYSGQTSLVLDRGLWAGLVAQELSDDLKDSILVQNQYDSLSRTLNVTVTVKYLTAVSEPQNISVMITESGIVDPQEYSGGIDTFYVHKHVFRKALTNAQGDAITESTNAGSRFVRSYSYKLPTKWVAKNCRVIAYVCDNVPASGNIPAILDVLQVAAANVE